MFGCQHRPVHHFVKTLYTFALNVGLLLLMRVAVRDIPLRRTPR
jgi:hypothetical protein